MILVYEVQNSPRRYGIINVPVLMELLELDNLEKLRLAFAVAAHRSAELTVKLGKRSISDDSPVATRQHSPFR